MTADEYREQRFERYRAMGEDHATTFEWAAADAAHFAPALTRCPACGAYGLGTADDCSCNYSE